MKTPAQTYDWPLIKRMYTDGQSAYAIAKLGGMPTKQAIQARAKREQWNGVTAIAQVIPPLPTTRTEHVTPELIARVLDRLRGGATLTLACMAEGMTDAYLRQLRKEEPALDSMVRQAQSEFVARKAREIDTAGERDWKASAWLLERHPLARDELKPRETKGDNQGLTVVIGIDRTKVSVSEDGRTLTVEPE
jgi:hypothetical protein